jgi:hypothetical protein
MLNEFDPLPKESAWATEAVTKIIQPAIDAASLIFRTSKYVAEHKDYLYISRAVQAFNPLNSAAGEFASDPGSNYLLAVTNQQIYEGPQRKQLAATATTLRRRRCGG